MSQIPAKGGHTSLRGAADAPKPRESRPISITPRAKAASGGKVIASSMPILRVPPPAAPARRPHVPSIEPPPFELPPSPSVFSQMELVHQAKQAGGGGGGRSMPRVLSSSLSHYSSSCPDTSFVPGVFSTSFRPLVEAEEDEDDSSMFGKSPTVLSMMGSASTSRGRADLEGVAKGLSGMSMMGRPALNSNNNSSASPHRDDHFDEGLLFSLENDNEMGADDMFE